ncbi:MAG: endonuclease/exonuclease/phosphatase family protein, partial [Novosphingobium sp.]|nr:endonuclease/exonuclease/phosphatase family protein [Novosphingobium sp.]
MELKFASYNIHKSVGLDGRRDPERILAILHEIDADVVAIQEADRRFGQRPTTLPRHLLEEWHWQVAPVALRPMSIGWHGNALLVRRGIDILDAEALHLPTLEPRGAVRVDLGVEGKRFRAVGMHLDLSGLRRRHQVQAVLRHIGECEGDCPTVLMGDLNEWS